MAKSNLNKQAKRKRELARLDKRAAKDEKRAQRKADARTAREPADAPAPAKTAGATNIASAGAPKAPSVAAAAFVRRLNIQRPS